MSIPPFTDPAVLPFIIIPVLLVFALMVADVVASRRIGERHAQRRRALGVVLAGIAWMGVTWRLAASGVLRNWEATPPPLGLLILAIVAIALRIALGPIGGRLARGAPMWLLVGIQGFRLPLELAMHAIYERGVMPEQMSYSGWNFDIVTGATAILVASGLWMRKVPRAVVFGWNVLGMVLLLNIITIAIVSTPLVQAFGPDRLNVWITYPPFVWLPAVMVLAALAGHLVIFRALISRSRELH